MQAKILIVDDEANLRKTMRVILSKAGFEVEEASEGKEALKILNGKDFDMAFVDLQMPGIGGIELLGKIRELDKDLPVIILTGNATLDTAIEAVRKGARDYIFKPADPNLIIARIRDILSEEKQPSRQREIVNQIQELVAELQTVTDQDGEVTQGLYNTLPAVDPERFLRKGVFILDLHARHLMLNNEYLALSPSNFDYMVTLVRHSPKSISYEKLVKESQGYDVTRHEAREMTRWRIHELRKTLETDPKNPQYIITMRGNGYRLIS